jgi:hypothetical protein
MMPFVVLTLIESLKIQELKTYIDMMLHSPISRPSCARMGLWTLRHHMFSWLENVL